MVKPMIHGGAEHLTMAALKLLMGLSMAIAADRNSGAVRILVRSGEHAGAARAPDEILNVCGDLAPLAAHVNETTMGCGNGFGGHAFNFQQPTDGEERRISGTFETRSEMRRAPVCPGGEEFFIPDRSRSEFIPTG